jgi:peptidoglycan/LPS O-acetylase OafA/YrhL
MAVPYLPLGKVAGDLLFVIAVLPPTMWLIAMAQPPQPLRAPMEWLGNFSLPLYCVHLTVLVWISELLGRSMPVAIAAFVAALVLAWAFSKAVSFASKPTQPKSVPATPA